MSELTELIGEIGFTFSIPAVVQDDTASSTGSLKVETSVDILLSYGTL